jgi:hypothetical protein
MRRSRPKRSGSWRERDSFDPYVEGYEAQGKDIARSANPYGCTDAGQLWDDGWAEGVMEMGDCAVIRAKVA